MNDLISRQAAIEALIDLDDGNEFIGYNKTIYKCANALHKLPSASKTGEWLIPQRRDGMSWNEKAYAECSTCHEVIFNARSMKFCPQCGAMNALQQIKQK